MTAIQPHTERRYYLDWLRVLLILLVFYAHSAMPFNTGADWAITNADKSFAITAFIGFCYQWGMVIFFMISGVGVGMSFHRRGAKAYVKERFLRLYVPLVVCVVTLIPLQSYLVAIHKGEFAGSLFEFLPYYFANTPYRLNLTLGLHPGHLWFLKFLFLFSVMALPIVLWLETDRGRRFIARVAAAFETRGVLFLCIIPLAIVQGALRAKFHAHHDWSDFCLWFVLFLYGYFYGVDRRFEEAVRRHGWVCLGIGAATFSFIGILFSKGYVEVWEYTPSYTAGYVFYECLRSVNSWCWAVFFVSMALRFLNRPGRWLSVANEGVLPFYILHHPIVVVFAFYLVQWQAGIPIKHAAITLPSLVVTIAVYLVVVRPSNPIRFVFGMRPKRPASAKSDSR